MQRRKLGTQGLEAGALGLGCMGMSEFYGRADEDEALATIHRALELGVSLLDTADMYGVGANERLVGRAVREWTGEPALIATKFANVRSPDGGFVGIRGDRAYVREACEASLRRLGVEVIDLYYQHRVDPDTPIEETVGAMAELVEEGKVRYLGLSEAGPETIRRAHATHPITALQTEYSLFSRDPEAEILPTLRELGIGFVPYSPLGRGLLTGAIRTASDLEAGDVRLERFPRFERENLERNLALVEEVRGVAEARDATPGQVALAWALAQGEDIVPIPGTKRVARLEENAAAADLELSPQELERLSSLFTPEAVAGERYAPAQMQALGR